jgi:hypothetical protein
MGAPGRIRTCGTRFRRTVHRADQGCYQRLCRCGDRLKALPRQCRAVVRPQTRTQGKIENIGSLDERAVSSRAWRRHVLPPEPPESTTSRRVRFPEDHGTSPGPSAPDGSTSRTGTHRSGRTTGLTPRPVRTAQGCRGHEHGTGRSGWRCRGVLHEARGYEQHAVVAREDRSTLRPGDREARGCDHPMRLGQRRVGTLIGRGADVVGRRDGPHEIKESRWSGRCAPATSHGPLSPRVPRGPR